MNLYDPRKSLWLNPNIQYAFNLDITEYDMRDAGFSLIKQFNLLPDNEIERLNRLDKGLERHKAIGILERDNKNLSNALLDKFTELRKLFIELNKITDNDIIAVRKDAIFTSKYCARLRFGQVEFIPKHEYTSYIRFPDIQNVEIYYSNDRIDIKGMGDLAVNRHRIYMLEFIRNCMYMIESDSIQKCKRYVMKFTDDYKAHALDDEYYIEFNNKSRELNPLFNYQKIIIPIIQILNRR